VLSLRQLEIAVGLLTILAAGVALFSPPFSPSPTASVGVGLFTGLTETATGIGGPPMALLYQHRTGPVLRSTVATCFLVGEVISLIILIGLIGAGRVAGDQLLAAAYRIPAGLIGTALSRMAHSRLNGPGLRLAVLAFPMVSDAALILKA
jgi:hypothetical protein